MIFAFAAPARAWEVKYPQAQLYAVEVWAQWCPNCKILDPEIEKAKAALAGKDVLFIRMDFTDKDSVYQSKMLAKALGLEAFLKANGAGTGYLAILDAATKQELARYTRDDDAAAIQKGVEEKLNASKSP